jgi:hypothetical protein
MTSQLQAKPAIWISLNNVDSETLNQLFWGIEEEGIPFKTSVSASNDIREEAHQAASLSPLAVGIACNQQEIVVHSRNLSPDNPLFQISLYKLGADNQLRHLGCNAARLVKGLPFKPV